MPVMGCGVYTPRCSGLAAAADVVTAGRFAAGFAAARLGAGLRAAVFVLVAFFAAFFFIAGWTVQHRPRERQALT
jgi:hypothetical protein